MVQRESDQLQQDEYTLWIAPKCIEEIVGRERSEWTGEAKDLVQESGM